jgi:hypothetical protein
MKKKSGKDIDLLIQKMNKAEKVIIRESKKIKKNLEKII